MVEPEPLIPPEAIPGHLLALQERRQPLHVIGAQGLELDGTVEGLEPARNRVLVDLTDLPSQTMAVGERVQIAFSAQGHRWVGQSRVQLRLERTRLALEIPTSLSRRDRRSSYRVEFNPPGTARAMMRLCRRGPALAGPLMDLSSGGFCMLLERVFDLESKQRLDPASLELAKGQPIDSLELTGLREDPVEASGVLRDLDQGPDGWVLHVQFRALLRADRAFLDLWSQGHIPPTPGLEAVPLPSLPVPVAPPAPTDRRTALLRLKKKLRSLLVVQEPGPSRDRLVQFLIQDGYGRVLVADRLLEVAEAFEGAPLHAVLVDGALPEAGAEAMAQFIHFARNDLACPVVLLLAPEDPRIEPDIRAVGADHGLRQPFQPEDLGNHLERWLGLFDAVPPAPAHPLKAFKSVGLVLEPGPRRDDLVARLGQLGFINLDLLGTVEELARAALKKPSDLLLLEGRADERETLALLRLAGTLRPEHAWRMVVTAPLLTESLVVACQQLGGIRLLAQPVEDDRLERALLDQLSAG